MKRRSILSSSVVVALAGFFVFAGAAAPAAAVPVTLTLTPAAESADRLPLFEGTGTPEAQIQLSVQSGQTCATSVSLTGTWSCQFVDNLPFGNHTLTAIQTPLVGAAETYTSLYSWWIYGTLPAPTITQPVEGGVWMSDPLNGNAGTINATYDASEVWGLQQLVAWATVDGVTTQYCTSGNATGGNASCYGGPIPDGKQVTFTAALDFYAHPSSPGLMSAPVTATVWEYRWVEVLEAPTSPSSDKNLHFAGVGTSNSPLELRDADGTVICTTTVTATGTWACDIAGPLEGGDYVISAYLTTPEGWEDQSFPEVLLTVVPSPVDPDPDPDPDPEEPPVTPPAAPAPPVAPPAAEVAPPPPAAAPPVVLPFRVLLDWSLDFGGIGQYYPGDSVTLTGRGLPPGASASAEIHSTPMALGSASAGADGAFTITSAIPLDVEPGAHSFVVTVTADNADASTISVPITVLPARAVPPAAAGDDAVQQPVRNTATLEIAETRPDSTTGPGSDAWEDADRSDPASTSALTESLATVSYLWANPVVLGVSAIVAVVLLLFVAFPAELLNSTLSEQYDKVAESRRMRAPEWWTRFRTAVDRVPVLGTLLFVLVAAVIFGFIDPRFGFDIVSLRVVLACAIGLVILALGANYLTAAIARRAWGLRATIDLRPFGLVIAAIGVALSRLLEFLPGIMIGVFAGLVLLGTASGTSRLRVTIVRAMVVWVIAVAAWIGYSVAGSLVGTSFGGNLTVEVLVALTTEGLTALLVGMLPFSFLEGSVVFAASKRSWLVLYFSIVLTWVVVVLPLNFVELRGPIWQWAIVAVAFALLAVVVSAGLAWRARRREAREAAEQELVSAR